MSTENGGEAVTVETTPNPPSEAGSSSQERDYEAEARSEGWVPEDEFRGDKRPAKFLSAQEFVERGDLFSSHRKKLDKLVDERVNERVGKMQKTFDRTTAQMQKQFERDLADAKEQRREAIKAGDVDKVEALDQKIDDLKTEAAGDEPGKKPPSRMTPAERAEWSKHNEAVQQTWMDKQDWWDVDADMTAFAIGFSNRLAAKDETITIEDNIAQTEAALAKKFPEQFGGKSAANGHAAVDGGGKVPGALKRAKTFSDLPAEAQAAWNGFDPRIKKDLPKEKYAKEYFDA